MSEPVLSPFESTIQITHIWLNEVAEYLGCQDTGRAYRALRAVLHALRDCLPADEAAALAARLPMLVRGFYYDGWAPRGRPAPGRQPEDFVAKVRASLGDDPGVDPTAATRAVLLVLAEHLAPATVEGVRRGLPAGLRSVWPAAGPPPAGRSP